MEDNFFLTSTQKKHWLFKEDELNIRRKKAHDRAIKAYSSIYGIEEANLVTLEEETYLINFFTLKIIKICQKMDYGWRVYSTAATFYKRFYLNNSIMNFDPSVMLLTAIFVAAKVEERFLTTELRGIDLKKLCKELNAAQKKKEKYIYPHVVIKSEILFMEGLKFHFYVFHSHELIKETFLIATGSKEATLASNKILEDWIIQIEEKIYLTDCLFLFPPQLLSLFSLVLMKRIENNIETYKKVGIETEEVRKKVQASLDLFLKKINESAFDKGVCKNGLKKLAKIQKVVREKKEKRAKT